MGRWLGLLYSTLLSIFYFCSQPLIQKEMKDIILLYRPLYCTLPLPLPHFYSLSTSSFSATWSIFVRRYLSILFPNSTFAANLYLYQPNPLLLLVLTFPNHRSHPYSGRQGTSNHFKPYRGYFSQSDTRLV